MPGNGNLHDSSRNKQDEFYTNLLLIEDEQKPYRAHFKGKRVLSNYGYTLTTPNGATLTRTITRDPYRRSLTLDCTTRFNNVVVSSFTYTFDAHNRPIARNDDRFAYNDRDEILSAMIGTNRIEHAYDTIGNHVFLAINSTTNIYANNQLNQTMASYACAPSVGSSGNNAPPLPIAHRSWHLHERHDFVYDDWNLIHETVTTVDANSTTNVTEIEYFWGPDLSNSLQGAGGVGGLLAVSQNGQFYFPVYDNLGNIVKYLDESGTVVASYIYDDFGRMLTATGTLATSFSFLFSTKYHEGETGLYYYDYRFYSSALKFWLNRELIEESGGDNLYVLSHNHPNISFDYLGCFEMHIHAEGVGHVGLRDKEGLTYDYGRYKGRYSQSRNPLYYSGPNILITGKDQSGHSYSVYKFDVCPLVDEKVSQVLKKKFDSGMKILPEEIIMRYDKKPDVLKVNERYMGSDWSPNNNCMTFSFSVLATAAREVLSDSHSSKSERDQARAMLALAFLSCWRYSPLDAKLMMDELASKSKFISKQ